ncbi:hypothetical protein RUM44_003969 [Polyplax serrata]|uniref:Uncharacterized protein n=1 Tax=Polyplax serrata TaxID=468196 RepID=A0ABR1B1I3_POLSC
MKKSTSTYFTLLAQGKGRGRERRIKRREGSFWSNPTGKRLHGKDEAGEGRVRSIAEVSPDKTKINVCNFWQKEKKVCLGVTVGGSLSDATGKGKQQKESG